MAGATVGNVRPMNPYADDQRSWVKRPPQGMPPQGMQSNTPDQGLRQYSENLMNDVAAQFKNVPKGVGGKRKRGGRNGMLPTDANSGGMIASPMYGRPPQGMQSNTPDQGLRQYSENLMNDVASQYKNVPKGVNGKRKRGGRKGMLPVGQKSGGMIAKPMPSKAKKPGNPMGAILGVTKAAPSAEREPGVRKRMMKEEEK